jgi:hypothetical protein
MPLACLDQSKQHRLPSSHLEKKKLFFSKEKFFFQLFNFMKWRRLRSSSHLTSSVLISKLSLFRYCLSSISSFSSPFFPFPSSFPSPSPSPFPAWDWISSMNSVFYLRINHLVMSSRHLHLNAFKSREFSCCRVLKSLFSSIKHLNILHLHILRILRLSSVFCFLRTITRSCNLWFLHL